LHAAFFRQLEFSLIVLAIEVPLGLGVALTLRDTRVARLALPGAPRAAAPDSWNVVGTIWQIFGRGDIGLGGVRSTTSASLQLHL